MTNFADYFSYDDFMVFVDHEINDPDNHARYRELVETKMEASLRGFLEALKAEGRLEPIPNAEGRSTPFLDCWNYMVTDASEFVKYPDSIWRSIANNFAHHLIFDPIYNGAQAIEKGNDPEWRSRYGKLIDLVTTGNFDRWFYSHLEAERCAMTDERLRLNGTGWKFELGKWTSEGFVPMEPKAPPRIVEMPFEFKTGNLLIADWFRIEEFTKSVNDYNKDYRGVSINSVAGRILQTEHLASKHGVLSVSVGNSSPYLFRPQDGVLAFANPADYDSFSPSDSQGMVITDLWAVTIIERERLVEIVADAVGDQAQAEQIVEDYLANNDVMTAKVEPGTHYVYFTGENEIFRDQFRCADVPLEGLDPCFVISDQRLELDNTITESAAFRR
jgi:hypothetical protein